MKYLPIFLLLISCGQKQNKPKQDEPVVERKVTIELENPMIINDGKLKAGTIVSGACGELKIGGQISEIFADYGQKLRKEKNEGEEIKIYQYYLKDELQFEIIPDENQIGEIEVFSPSFKTKTGFGVGTEISSFIKKYSSASMWYTYVSDRFVLDCSELESVQFMLSREDYIGKKKLGETDSDQLTISDFKPAAKIISIRIF